MATNSQEVQQRADAKRKQKRATTKQSGQGRTRNFATIVYPESAPENWDAILAEHKVPAFISPLHDADIDPIDPNDLGLVENSQKKPHHHVMIMFGNSKTPQQAQALFQTIGGVGWEPINDLRSYARYLCHLDSPHKAQYPTEGVTSLCGADYLATIGMTADKYKAIGEMIDFCEEQCIISFQVLFKYSRSERQDWFRVLCDSGSAIIDRYLKSKEWTERQEREQQEQALGIEQRQLQREEERLQRQKDWSPMLPDANLTAITEKPDGKGANEFSFLG